MVEIDSSNSQYFRISDIKCFSCEFIKCIDFFGGGERGEGEFAVLRETIKLHGFPPCIPGGCLYCLCRLFLALSKNDDYIGLPVTEMLVQCMYDLKSSVFLAFCGHYRSAIQVLRSVVENFLVGLYFTFLENIEAYDMWWKGEYVIPDDLFEKVRGRGFKAKKLIDYGFILEFLVKEKVIKSKMKGWIESRIIGPINNYLHPNPIYFEIHERWGDHGKCPAAVKFNERKFKEWLTLFQRIVWLILRSLFDMFTFEYFEKDEDGFDGLSKLLLDPETFRDFIQDEKYCELIKRLQKRFEERLKEKQSLNPKN